MRLAPLKLLRIKILDIFRKTNQLAAYKRLLENQFVYTSQDIDLYQQAKINEIVLFHYENNIAYRRLLKESGYQPSEQFDFNKIPIIDKGFFRENSETCFNEKEIAFTKYSGGSTGSPLPVYLSRQAIKNFWPSIWRSFATKGALPCDRIMMIAGPSLFNNRTLQRRIYDWVSGFTVVSAFDLSDKVLESAYKTLVKKNIKVIYGYTSSVLVFLQYLQRNGLKLKLNSIFTTSETFIPAVRGLAKEFCSCDVIDTYGANDGGIQAFECEYHVGYHINFERCYIEIIDGEIILTDLLNTAAPFIRYRVGDYTTSNSIIKDRCSCGRSLYRITDISGKINQFIEDLDSKKIHAGFFSLLFKTDENIIRYQVIQKSGRLIINIVHNNRLNDNVYIKKYADQIAQKFLMPSEFIFNQKIITLPNMKTPILVKED